jgi:hypothetical protein
MTPSGRTGHASPLTRRACRSPVGATGNVAATATTVPESHRPRLAADATPVQESPVDATGSVNGLSECANHLLDKHRHLLERTYDVCLVVSADNPADCPSRGEPMEAQRIVNLNHAIASHCAGAMGVGKERG